MQRDRDALVDILEACLRVEEYMTGVARDVLESDSMRLDAVVRQIGIIGEATKRPLADFRRRHPDVPWSDIAGMRDVVVHAYDEVDVDEVWKAASTDVPASRQSVKALLLTFEEP